MVQDQSISDLTHYRRRMKFTQGYVTRLLEWKNLKGLWQLESGNAIPTLITAFKLSIIYRVPTDFLFAELYEKLKREIRAKEMALAPVGAQQELPLTFASNHDS
jgi:hypothetical protein